jgi:hypothetical protein
MKSRLLLTALVLAWAANPALAQHGSGHGGGGGFYGGGGFGPHGPSPSPGGGGGGFGPHGPGPGFHPRGWGGMIPGYGWYTCLDPLDPYYYQYCY